MSRVKDEVRKREARVESASGIGQEALRVPGILIASVIYSIGINMFLRPLHLYSGGFMGFAQLLTTLLRDFFGVNTGKLDLSGIFYYLFNLPAIVIAFRTMRKRFVVKSVLTVTCITALLTIVPIPAKPILEERIANCLVAGIMAGAGVGLSLLMGASDGGMDLIGMILVQKNGHFSVGKVNIAANCVLYGICLLLFDIPTVIYSLIYSVISSMMCDRVHIQNINSQVLIVTKLRDTEPMEIEIMGEMNRGLTRWEGKGSFTGEQETILMAVVNKQELHQLLVIVRSHDPAAFVMVDEGVGVEGHFLRKIT